MKFMLISDNHDTLVGMRLAGIEGVVVHDVQGVKKALNESVADPEVAVVLITQLLAGLADDIIGDLKLNSTRPLIVEIPDRHGDRGTGSISKYISEAIGIKI